MKGVFTRLKRFTLVEKSASEVSDGTAWPMLVTRDQLAEVMYRVRDHEWESGEAGRNAINIDDEVAFTSSVTFTTATIPTEKIEWELQSGDEDSAYTRRAYVTTANLESPGRPMDDWSDAYFSTVTHITIGGTNASDTNALAYREAVSERALWAVKNNDPDFVAKFESGEEIDTFHGAAPTDEFKTGFSFFGSSWTDSFVEPGIYAPVGYVDGTSYLGAAVGIVFSGEVAWVDDDESGNPFSPGNRLFLGLRFFINDGMFGIGIESGAAAFSTLQGDLRTPAITDYFLKLQLSGVDQFIQAPIYFGEGNISDFGYTFTVASMSDWIFKATEWWPYAKDDPATPVWDVDTGVKI